MARRHVRGCRVGRALLYRMGSILLVVLALAGCGRARTGRLFAATWFGFVEIADGIYADEPMPIAQRDQLINTVQTARGRVSGFFGRLKGKPDIFACSTETCFVSNGGTTAQGNAFGASMVLLSPRGLDVVTIAHELSHIELYSRVGPFRAWQVIPPWFDEGLAVLVSQDPEYTTERWLVATENGRKVPALQGLGRVVPWRNSQLSYGTAKRAVEAWYSRVGAKGLAHLVRKLKEGKDFDTVFNASRFKPAVSGRPTGPMPSTAYQ